MDALIGTKVGMTRIFDENGRDLPITVIAAGPCTVSQVKTIENDGYQAVQLAFGARKERNITKPMLGHLKRAGLKTARVLHEFRTSAEHKIGDVITVEIFTAGEQVKVAGTTKGKGFTGVMKRHGFHGGSASHGKSNQLRAGGSVGASSDPSRVFPGQRMPGRSGGALRTAINIKVVKVLPDSNQIFVLGSIPGPANGTVYITRQS